MNSSKTFPNNWLNLDLAPDEFRQLGYRVIDMITEYYQGVADYPVFPMRTSAQVAQDFDESLPEHGQKASAIIDEWTSKILPNSTHLGSPRYFGYVNGSGTMIATLAEALAAAVNMNVGAWKPAPSATEIERRTISWIAELINYSPTCGGLFTSGGTMANVTAILTALRNTAEFDTTQDGLQGVHQNGRFTIYMSDHEGHISIIRAADMLNLGRTAVRRVSSNDDLTMNTDALRRLLDEDSANGDIPFCVIAQVGSINIGAIDPLEEIAEICSERNLWFHADGACGAFGAMLPEKQSLYKGLERADSITLDPHKWLFIPYECGCVLVRDPEKLRRAFSISAPYLRGTLPTEYTGLDYLEYGPQMSRGFRALKIWMSLKHYGAEGYRNLLRQGIQCANYLDQLVRRSEEFEALHHPILFIYSFRWAPKHYQQAMNGSTETNERINNYLDRLNQQIADQIQADGTAFLMTSKIHGRTVLRFSICSHRTTPVDIGKVFTKLKELGSALDEKEEQSQQSI
ncbi:MAG: aspartate aminotransferase family protein [Candidatus Promineifilaceae bacterium]|nr:aspartate aminotransferase family protein [Candidatus Promineifilaceae bacterium]